MLVALFLWDGVIFDASFSVKPIANVYSWN